MKVGIIGCGGISRFHFVGYEKAGCEIAWCCDIKEENAKNWASKYGSKVTTDYMDVLNDPEVKMVSVTVMTNLHNEIVKAAAKAGKAILCEKTLGMDAPDALDIMKTATKYNSWLSTAYMKRYFPAVKKAKEIIEETGAEVISVYARTYQPWKGSFLGPFDGCAEISKFLSTFLGGGVLVCGGSHILNLLNYFCGLPKSCCGEMNFAPTSITDRCANAMLWFENGAVAHFEASWHEYRKAGFEKNGWDERFEINTTKGQIKIATPQWDEPERNAARVSYLDAVSGEFTEYRYEIVNPFHEQVKEAVECVEKGLPPIVNGWDGYIVDVMIDAIKEAHETNSKVEMKWAPEFLATLKK